MINKQIIKEFGRWILAKRPAVWYKRNEGSWECVNEVPSWNNEDIYIVDDEQAELRKLQIDKPDTKFQVKRSKEGIWKDCDIPSWYKGVEYRVKPKPKIERRWRYARDANGYTTIASIYMSDSFAKNSKYLENGWYKLKNNYIDVLIDKE